jgi:uncharacterized protein HemX
VAAAAAILVALLAAGGPARAQDRTEAIAEEVAATGSVVEQELTGDLEAAVEEANRQGIAVVVLADATRAVELAPAVLSRLEAGGSRFRTVLAVTREGAAAASAVHPDVGRAIDPGSAAFDAFRRGDNAGGVRLFTAAVTGQGQAPAPGDPARFPWATVAVVLAVGALGVVAVQLVRRDRARRQARAMLEADRGEIREQLRDNAAHVIELGDRALATGDPELIELYEQASATFRHVSHDLDHATTAEAVDRLDERLDEAEWQFQVLEARLDGRPPPARPAPGP